MTAHTSILGLGSYLPETVMTNADIARMVDTNDEWIVTRTGIRERHVLPAGKANSDMAYEATLAALADAGLEAGRITHILYATCTPDEMCPSTACILAGRLGVKHVFALDINAACSGFVYGLSLVRGLLAAEPDAVILLVASDVMTSCVNWEDRGTCILFGDGAGVLLFGAGKGKPVLRDVLVSSDGSLHPLLRISGGGSAAPHKLGDCIGPENFVRMEGREVFKHAVRSMTGVCHELLARNALSVADIDLFIPHQANLRIIEAVGTRLGISAEKTFVNVQVRGNTSAASIPIAFAEARSAGLVKPGMKVLFATFGGGFTWGSALIES